MQDKRNNDAVKSHICNISHFPTFRQCTYLKNVFTLWAFTCINFAISPNNLFTLVSRSENVRCQGQFGLATCACKTLDIGLNQKALQLWCSINNIKIPLKIVSKTCRVTSQATYCTIVINTSTLDQYTSTTSNTDRWCTILTDLIFNFCVGIFRKFPLVLKILYYILLICLSFLFCFSLILNIKYRNYSSPWY